MRFRHVILDRDGVLNREAPCAGWVTDPDQWQWEAGALDGLCRLSEAGLRISIATNQSCVGRGKCAESDIVRVNERMRQLATEAGARIDAVFVCPHAPEDHCDCRKPLPGLILQAIEQAGIPRRNTVVVGDAARDLEAASEAGVRAILVRTGKGRYTEDTLGGDEIAVYDHLDQAAAALLGEDPA